MKENGGMYKVCTSPNMRPLEKYFRRVIELAPRSKALRKITQQEMSMCRMPHVIHVISYMLN